ncbi:hypothetical protein AYO44_17510 [Planctomycetaceae bacterium SCGC AG-212-F19]|nr:hypothetical protein AYO44_17510 [Planctomycetaceae bacterium SCGC AG-212-F19]
MFLFCFLALGIKMAAVLMGSVGIGLTVVFLVMHIVEIGPAQIDEQSIILKNVSEEFAKAVAESPLHQPPLMSIDREGIQAAVPENATPQPIEPPDQHIQPGSP